MLGKCSKIPGKMLEKGDVLKVRRLRMYLKNPLPVLCLQGKEFMAAGEHPIPQQDSSEQPGVIVCLVSPLVTEIDWGGRGWQKKPNKQPQTAVPTKHMVCVALCVCVGNTGAATPDQIRSDQWSI